MEILGRVNVYLDLLRNENARLSNEIFNLVCLNERILRDVEPLFLRDNDLQNKDVLFQSALATVVEAGINLEEARNIPTYRKLLEELDNIAKSKVKTPNKFNSLIKTLSGFNDNVIEELTKQRNYIFKDYSDNSFLDSGETGFDWNAYSDYLKANYKKEKQVFLSYAYEDKLYTIALFFYFQKKNIFLFVDWMNNGKEEKGIKLKYKLHSALAQSDHLLFLRTPNSELRIGGNYYIRPWCSWELGNFYDRLGSREKYYIDLYEHEKNDNMQLDGIKLLTGVRNEELEGVLV